METKNIYPWVKRKRTSTFVKTDYNLKNLKLQSLNYTQKETHF